jgi:hypothetical protein
MPHSEGLPERMGGATIEPAGAVEEHEDYALS